MQTCPFCKEEVRDDAVKCRYCQSLLRASASAEAEAARQVTYVLDKDLVRFAKFSAAVLAVFIVVGAYFFGFKLEAAVERVNALQKEAETASKDLKQSQVELQSAKSTVIALKNEVQSVLSQANSTLAEIGKQKDAAVAIVVSIRELSPSQEQLLEKVKSSAPEKTRGGRKYWAVGATIRIAFLGGTAKEKEMVKRTAVEWLKYANVAFTFVESGDADVRIAFDPSGGSWSFVGTDALGVAHKEPTMNLGWTQRQNVLHEFGHVLGLIEEHQNPRANIKWNIPALQKDLGGPPNNWTKEVIQKYVFEVVPKEQIGDYREFDPSSIMTYAFSPSWTGGMTIGGGSELSESDKQLVRRLYPRA